MTQYMTATEVEARNEEHRVRMAAECKDAPLDEPLKGLVQGLIDMIANDRQKHGGGPRGVTQPLDAPPNRA